MLSEREIKKEFLDDDILDFENLPGQTWEFKIITESQDSEVSSKNNCQSGRSDSSGSDYVPVEEINSDGDAQLDLPYDGNEGDPDKQQDAQPNDIDNEQHVETDTTLNVKKNINEEKTKNIVRLHDQNVHKTSRDEKPITTFKCEKCDKEFTLAASLLAHKRIHTNESPYKCEICDQRFYSIFSKDLERHYLKHTGERPHKCTICEVTYRYTGNLFKHIRQKHNIVDGLVRLKKFECKQCSYTSMRKSVLNRHKQTHIPMDERERISCTKCHLSFLYSDQLNQHMKLSHGNYDESEKLKCKICNKTFATVGGKKEHISRVHSKEKRFQCTVCDYKLFRKCDMKRHLIRQHLIQMKDTYIKTL